METCEILSLIPAPLVAGFLYFLLRNKYPNGKFGLFFKCFLIGFLGIILVFAADTGISYLRLNSLHSLNRTLFYSFVLTAGVFELIKFLVLKFVAFPTNQVKKSIDGILYSLVVAAGFTTSYSLYAIYYAPAYINDCLYAYSVGPVFVSIAVIMGYFTGIAKVRQYPAIDIFTGLFLSVIFQGIYRFCLLTTDTALMYMAMAGMMITAITLLVIAFREASESN